MLFSDFTHPSTVAVLLVEATVFGLALAAAFLDVLVRPVRWLAGGLAGATLVLGLGGAAGMAMELWTFPLPLVLPDAPLGTYAQMTQLGLMLGIVQFGLIALGRRSRSAHPLSADFCWCSPGSSAYLMGCAAACRMLPSHPIASPSVWC